jgi:hypothetical protein
MDDLLNLVLDNPAAAILAGAVVGILLVLFVFRKKDVRSPLAVRIDALKRVHTRTSLDKRYDAEGDLKPLMDSVLSHWPHDPIAFYAAVLQAAETMSARDKPPPEWDEVQSNPTLQEIAQTFWLLMDAIAHHPKPQTLVPKAQAAMAQRLRREHLNRSASG